jgi:hypothetical protein
VTGPLEVNDKSILKAMNTMLWLISENLSKYGSLVHLMRDLEVLGLDGLA